MNPINRMQPPPITRNRDEPTPRERQILELLAVNINMSHGELAETLAISLNTLNGYLTMIRLKLGTRTTEAAVLVWLNQTKSV